MWTSQNKKLYVFLGIILIIGIICGIIFVLMFDESTKEIIFLNINEAIQNVSNVKVNNIISHIIILSSLLILSLLVIGIPLTIFFMFYNGFSLGFITTSLTMIFGLKGLLYGIIYCIITKFIFLSILFIFSSTQLKIVKNMFDGFIKKTRVKEIINILWKKSLLCIAIILISDIILYFCGTSLINLFKFLIN